MQDPQNTPHTLTLRASYVVPFVNIWEKIDHVKTAPHCILYILSRMATIFPYINVSTVITLSEYLLFEDNSSNVFLEWKILCFDSEFTEVSF